MAAPTKKPVKKAVKKTAAKSTTKGKAKPPAPRRKLDLPDDVKIDVLKPGDEGFDDSFGESARRSRLDEVLLPVLEQLNEVGDKIQLPADVPLTITQIRNWAQRYSAKTGHRLSISGGEGKNIQIRLRGLPESENGKKPAKKK